MPLTPEQIDNLFTYHPPKPGQVDAYVTIREEARKFAHTINNLTPPGSDQDVAILLLRAVGMFANASIACHVPADTRPIGIPAPRLFEREKSGLVKLTSELLLTCREGLMAEGEHAALIGRRIIGTEDVIIDRRTSIVTPMTGDALVNDEIAQEYTASDGAYNYLGWVMKKHSPTPPLTAFREAAHDTQLAPDPSHFLVLMHGPHVDVWEYDVEEMTLFKCPEHFPDDAHLVKLGEPADDPDA